MKFLLLKGERPTSVLTWNSRGVFAGSMRFQTVYHQIDETPASTFLKEMTERIVSKYASNATQQCCYLTKPLFDKAHISFNLRRDHAKFSVTVEGRTLKILRDIFPEKSVLIRVKFAECSVNTRCIITQCGSKVFSRGMRVEDNPDVIMGGLCVDDNVSIPRSWEPYLEERVAQCFELRSKISVEVSIPDFGIGIRDPGSSTEMITNLTKNILTRGIQSDVVIITGSGREFKCHKNFLAARSPVLAAMFRNKCKEASDNKIEMKEMTEEVVEHFLTYLYCGELTWVDESCQMIFDLFEAGHKYEVASLVEHVKQILLQKPDEWFDANVALRIFCLYGSLDDFDDLNKKMLQVMKEKYEELEGCDEYQQLFAKDPKGSMRLCKYLFSL